ncbi:hypothetical protein [Serratia fonticola]
MSKILLNTSKIIGLLLSLSLLIYITTGFLAVFTHDIGPLSAVLGSVASFITCGIAIRALIAARKWHSDKIKAEMFSSAQNTLLFTKKATLLVLLISNELALRLSLLNKRCGELSVKEKSIEILIESKEFINEYSEVRHDSLNSLIESVRFSNYITTKYRETTDLIYNEFTSYIGLLTEPFKISDDGVIILNPKINEIQNKMAEIPDEILNELGYEKISGFINLDKAAKEAIAMDS